MTHRDDDDPSHSAPSALGFAPLAAKTVPVDCHRLATLLGDYVDDQLPTDIKTAVDGHMAQCAPCMAFLKQYRFAPEALRQMLLRAVPADLENRLVSFLRARCTGAAVDNKRDDQRDTSKKS